MDGVLQVLTQGVFVLVALISLVDYLRHRDRARLDVAALFGVLAALILLQGAMRLSGITAPWVGTAAAALFFAHPYLLLRVVAHFRRVPVVQRSIVLAALLATVIAVVVVPRPYPAAVNVGLLGAFVYGEGYAAIALLRAALQTRGVTQRRLVAIAAGSGLLAAIILVAGALAAMPQGAASRRIVSEVTQLLALGAAVGYFLGCAPPRWLRRAWQMDEFRRFVAALSGRSADDRLNAALDHLGPAAARAVGGTAGLTLIGDAAQGRLRLHINPEHGEPLRKVAEAELALGPDAPLLGQALREAKPLCVHQPEQHDAALGALARAAGGAGSALLVPLVARGTTHGVLVAFMERGPLFLDDDLALLVLLAEQAALVLEEAEHFRKVQDYAAALEAARREAERANHAKSEFLSRMSHELRTPLNAVLGFAQLLEMDPLAPEQRDSVEHILKAGRHLLSLINEVLDIARIEAGRLSLSPEPVRISEVVEETIDLVRPLAADRHITVMREDHGTGDRYVQADRQRLKQVLLNLLSNGIKYNRDGGSVTVSCALAETPGDEPASRLRLSVRDTGGGISAEMMDRLFVPFDRLGADQSGVEGTGLGLTLSKGLVEAMAGKMEVQSRLGEGSTFTVELPVVESQLGHLEELVEDLPAAELLPEGPTVQKVLYVEDNLSNLTLVERLLARRPGIALIPAMQGGVGLDLAREHHPDLILLDVHLPDITGDEVLRRLQSDPETRSIPVVVVSADATPRQIERLRAAGARDYLTKPLDVPQFMRVLDDTLDQPGARGGTGNGSSRRNAARQTPRETSPKEMASHGNGTVVGVGR